jgi:hypothetical protein
MKKRAVHSVGGLAAVRDGRWLDRDGKLGDRVEQSELFDVIRQVFDRCGWLRKNGKAMSEKSKTDYGNHILRSYSDLRELGYRLQLPWNLEQRHIEALCQHWSQKGLTSSTLQNRLGALSWFAAVIGRPGLIRGTHDYEKQFGGRDMQRHQSTERDKSPEGHGYNREQVVGLAFEVDPLFGHLVMLQYALGLRDKEAVRARPLLDMRWVETDPLRQDRKRNATPEQGAHWVLPPEQGSKGGRARIVLVRQGEWQIQYI